MAIRGLDDFIFLGNRSPDPCDYCGFSRGCELLSEQRQLSNGNTGNDIPAYRQMNREHCLKNHSMVKHCGSKCVTDGIGDDFRITINPFSFKIKDHPDRWDPSQPVFISAQTGQGKNYFVENALLPHVRDLNLQNKTNQKVLIISNRLALKKQIESRIKSPLHSAAYSHEKYADVITYQALLNQVDALKRKQRSKCESYIFVICDEAHFFTSDATFNPDTGKILAALVSTFEDAIRIYMSATPYECLGYIAEYEKKYAEHYQTGIAYHFRRNYSYLDVKYYSSHSELVDVIVKSRGERWLIFIDDRERGQRLKNELEGAEKKALVGDIEEKRNFSPLKGKIMLVDAASKGSDEYQRIVATERFGKETTVLITTSVLDNGVNFRDIQNVVVSDISKTKCLQMAGRARVEGENQRVTLYIKRVDKKLMKKRISNLAEQQDAYHDYDLAFDPSIPIDGDSVKQNYKEMLENKFLHGSAEDWNHAKLWFGGRWMEPSRILPYSSLYFNEIARSLVDKLVPNYESILHEMQETGKDAKLTGQQYLEYQLSWFGKVYDKKNDISLTRKENTTDELINFLESCVGRRVFADEREEFRKKFTALYDSAFGSWDKNVTHGPYGIDVIQKILEKHNTDYQILSCRAKDAGKRTYWEIVRHSGISDSETETII